METPKHMERITFLDGQILHDFHLNTMQRNIAESIKLKTTKERYDMLMLVSPYNFYFAEAFVNNDYRDETSTSILNTLTFSIEQDSWITPVMELPVSTDEFFIYSDYNADEAYSNYVDFYYRTGEENNWIQVDIDQPIYIPTTKYFQFRVDCRYSGTSRPTVYDYAVMFK